MKIRAQVTIELEAPDEDAVSDLVHETWGAGDPEDATNACIVVDSTREVERFSWENAPACAWPVTLPAASRMGTVPKGTRS